MYRYIWQWSWLSGSPEKNWQLFPWSKPPLSRAHLTLEPLLGDFLRFVIVTQTDESHFLSSQLIKFLLLQIIYHTPTAPRLVYYSQSPESSKPINHWISLDARFLPKKMTRFRQHMPGPVVQNWAGPARGEIRGTTWSQGHGSSQELFYNKHLPRAFYEQKATPKEETNTKIRLQ